MAGAELTGVSGLVHLECLCANCELREGGNVEPDYMQLRGARIDGSGKMLTAALVSSPDNYRREILINGIAEPKHAVESFDTCEGPEILEGKIICGAIANISRRKQNG